MKKTNKNIVGNIQDWQKAVSAKITEIEENLVRATRNLEELQTLLGIKCEH